MDTLTSNSIPLAKCTPPQPYHATPNTKHQRNCSRYSFANLLTCQLFRSLAEFSLDLSALSYKLAIHFNIFVQLGLQAPLSNLIRRIHIDPIPSTLHIYLATKTGSFSPTTLNLEPNGTKTMQNAQGKNGKHAAWLSTETY